MCVLLAGHGCHLFSQRRFPASPDLPENIPAAEIAPWQQPQPIRSRVNQETAGLGLGFHQGLHVRRLGDPPSSSAAQVSPSIVVIIIVLTVIFFLSAFLHLLIRWLARNPALIRRGFRSNTSGSTGSNNRIVTLTALQGQLQQLFSLQDAGLDRSLIEELPVFSYKAAMDGLKEGADCAICLCEFVADDQLRLLPLCGHAFHTECIDTWLLSHSTCPLCRSPLLPGYWIPDALQPLLSSEMSLVGDAAEAHHQVTDVAVPAPLSGRFPGHGGTSSRRSSIGRVLSIVAGTDSTVLADHGNHVSQESAECQSPPAPDGNNYLFTSASNHADSAMAQEDPCTGNTTPLTTVRTVPSRGMASSAGLASSDQERSLSFTRIGGKPCMISDPDDRVDCTANKVASDGTSSANSGVATMIMDSGRLSHTSLGNQTDLQSDQTYNEIDRASVYGSGRRVSVHLGKCRMVQEEGVKGTRTAPRMIGDSSRRTFSKGSYEYVINSCSNLEVIIPPAINLAINLNPQSKPPALISVSKRSELLTASNRTSLSSAEAAQTMAHGHRDLVGKNSGLSWASASFRKFALCDGVDAQTNLEAMDVPLNRSQPSDKPESVDGLPVLGTEPEFAESSAATSLRANVGSDASLSPEMVNQRLRELCIVGTSNNGAAAEQEAAKGAVSFRLPTTASHDVLCARLKASASRRALSESEAFSHWEPTTTEEDMAQTSDDRRLFLDDGTASRRSSSFARRTMGWLAGWKKRMVHPDK